MCVLHCCGSIAIARVDAKRREQEDTRDLLNPTKKFEENRTRGPLSATATNSSAPVVNVGQGGGRWAGVENIDGAQLVVS